MSTNTSKITTENFDKINTAVSAKLKELIQMNPKDLNPSRKPSASQIVEENIEDIKVLLDAKVPKKTIMDNLSPLGLDIKLTTFNTLTTKYLKELEEKNKKQGMFETDDNKGAQLNTLEEA